MKYIRITNIDDPLFKQMYHLMQTIFPPEEVLDFELWAEPLTDPDISVFVAVDDGEVVGATEYRYYKDMRVAMTDFTIIGREGLGIGPFLMKNRERDLKSLFEMDRPAIGMFAEIYNPYLVSDLQFGGIKPMDPFVRREVLAHMGYRKLDLQYVHPSWHNNGEAVQELDLCFLTYDETINEIPAALVAAFLRRYYAVLQNKPEEWLHMLDKLEGLEQVRLLAI